MIVGHNHPAVRQAVKKAVEQGLSFGAPCAAEVTMAETITRLVPSCELVRMVNSGTEATLSAIRLARGATGRNRIVKFEGCYHGHGDSFLVKAGSGMLTLGVPTSPGVPAGLSELTLTLPYNDFEAATALFEAQGSEIAGLIIEPVVGNANCIPPRDGYLQHLRALCTHHGSLLVLDEVMTGFRVALGGAQSVFAQALPGFHDDLAARTARLCEGLEAAAAEAGVAVTTTRVGAMFGLFFTSEKVETYAQATACDIPAFNRFFHAMLDQGVFLAPSAYEAGFLSSAHDDAVIEATLAAARVAFKAAKG
jgi:glutamate-1-semialdehyde 2,1-aminomutase